MTNWQVNLISERYVFRRERAGRTTSYLAQALVGIFLFWLTVWVMWFAFGV